MQIRITTGSGEEFPDDQQRPPVPDGIEGAGGGAVLVVASTTWLTWHATQSRQDVGLSKLLLGKTK
ncbi:hypothetical protein GCM10010394_45470 [Streptomyces crystallinus]|uniref:Uncharacterized protein n=1 Tax=Streptomyces crystallinus TaxID=68191 RepID=A0ABN1GFJ3_9ACTN